MIVPSAEQQAKIANQLSAMQQASKLHPHDWRVLESLIESALTALREERDRLEQRRQHQVSELLFDWREQDNILQKIAALVGDEHVTSADGVLKAIAHLTEEREGLRKERHEVAAFLTGAGEMAWVMAHPDGEPQTPLGKAAEAISNRAFKAERQLAALTEGHERLKANANAIAYDKCCLHDDLEEARQDIAALSVEACVKCSKPEAEHGDFGFRDHQFLSRHGEGYAAGFADGEAHGRQAIQRHAEVAATFDKHSDPRAMLAFIRLALLSPREGTPREPHE